MSVMVLLSMNGFITIFVVDKLFKECLFVFCHLPI